MRIRIDGNPEDGWYLQYIGERPLPQLRFYTGPFVQRNEAARAIPEYRGLLEAAFAAPASTAKTVRARVDESRRTGRRLR